MKVECISNQITSENSNEELVDWANNSDLEITIGKVYVVFAISKYMNFIFYYVLGDESNSYPLAFPSVLFRLVDNKISKFWVKKIVATESLQELDIENGEVVSFKEWSLNGDGFYEKLLEEEKSEIRTFNKYREKMLKE